MHMKTSLNFLFFFLLASGCTKKADTTSEAAADEWPQMEAFHAIIADAYHPFKDSANVAPARELAESLALEADKWQAASLPEKVNTKKVQSQLVDLKTSARALSDQIKSGRTDEVVGALLTTVHDNFHKIMEAWYEEGEKHKH